MAHSRKQRQWMKFQRVWLKCLRREILGTDDLSDHPELERGTGLAEVDQPPLLPDRSPQTDSSDCKSQVDGNSGTMEKATLVLDLDETLIHSVVDPVSNETTTHQRPGLSHFLQQVASMFEVVVFTAGLEDYASPIIDSLDPQGLIQHRLFRQHVRCIRGTHLIKDLASLNRPLARVVIVDNSAESFLLQPLNAIPIEPYLGEAQDTRLFELLPLLQALASAPDVRQLLAVCHAACDFTCVPAQLPGRTKLTGSLTPGKQGTVAAPDSSCASPCPCATPSASMPSQVSPVASQPHACSHSPACTALPTGEQSPEVVHEDAARLCQGRADMRAARAAGSSPWLQYARAPRGSAGNTSDEERGQMLPPLWLLEREASSARSLSSDECDARGDSTDDSSRSGAVTPLHTHMGSAAGGMPHVKLAPALAPSRREG